MKYLGIRLGPDLEYLIAINMSPLIKKIKQNLDKWKLINLTLWGKMKIIKMVIAPQCNNISMMISVTISGMVHLKESSNNLIKEFLWNGKKNI